MAPARRVLALALCSRAALLLALLASDAAFTDLDSSTRLAAALPCASASSAAAPPPAAAARPLVLLVWDTAYFSRIAKCGYETDKINAFFPLLPAVMRAAAAVAGARASLPSAAPAAPACRPPAATCRCAGSGFTSPISRSATSLPLPAAPPTQASFRGCAACRPRPHTWRPG